MEHLGALNVLVRGLTSPCVCEVTDASLVVHRSLETNPSPSGLQPTEGSLISSNNAKIIQASAG
jgi:hypothetical protein